MIVVNQDGIEGRVYISQKPPSMRIKWTNGKQETFSPEDEIPDPGILVMQLSLNELKKLLKMNFRVRYFIRGAEKIPQKQRKKYKPKDKLIWTPDDGPPGEQMSII